MEVMTPQEIKTLSYKHMADWKIDSVIAKSESVVKDEITIVGYPSKNSISSLSRLIEQLKSFDSTQTYYDLEDLHLTFLGDLLPDLRIEKLQTQLEKVFKKYDLQFEIEDLVANESKLAIMLFPVNFKITDLRKEIRALLGEPEKPYKNSAYFENIGWISIMTFNNKPNENLFNFIKNNYMHKFGSLFLDKVEVSRLCSKDRSQILNKEILINLKI
jgi:hypothetical protein